MAATLNDPHVVELLHRLSEVFHSAKVGGAPRPLVHYDESSVSQICSRAKLMEAFGLLRELKLVKVVDLSGLPGIFEITPAITQAASAIEIPGTPVAASKEVILFGRDQPPSVSGTTKSDVLTTAQYDTIRAMIEAGADGLTKDQLIEKSGRSDPRGILRRLSKKDPDWDRVIRFAGKTGRRYRIR